MRTVVYFRAGTVGDFAVEDDRFAAFSAQVPRDIKYDDDELTRARRVLGAFMAADVERPVSATEEAAACFVWTYFNTHPDPQKHIQGDVLVIDLNGDGETVDYAAVDDVDLVQEQ